MFTLTLAGVTTANITYTTTASTTVTNIQNALNAAFGANLFAVSAFNAADNLNYVIAGNAGLANTNLPQFTTVGVPEPPVDCANAGAAGAAIARPRTTARMARLMYRSPPSERPLCVAQPVLLADRVNHADWSGSTSDRPGQPFDAVPLYAFRTGPIDVPARRNKCDV